MYGRPSRAAQSAGFAPGLLPGVRGSKPVFGSFRARCLARRAERARAERASAVLRQCFGSASAVLRQCFGRDLGGRRSGPFFSRDLFFGKRSVLSNNMYARETLTGTSSERLSPSNFGVQVCWDMSVQMQMHTLWRFDGEPSRMPSVSRALWAACIHSRDGATPPASSTAMASASATREVDIASLFTGTPFVLCCKYLLKLLYTLGYSL